MESIKGVLIGSKALEQPASRWTRAAL